MCEDNFMDKSPKIQRVKNFICFWNSHNIIFVVLLCTIPEILSRFVSFGALNVWSNKSMLSFSFLARKLNCWQYVSTSWSRNRQNWSVFYPENFYVQGELICQFDLLPLYRDIYQFWVYMTLMRKRSWDWS